MKKAVCCAVLAALAFGAGAAEWFDAGIAGYSSWPSQGQDFSVSGVGTWTETSLASRSLEDGAIIFIFIFFFFFLFLIFFLCSHSLYHYFRYYLLRFHYYYFQYSYFLNYFHLSILLLLQLLLHF